MSNRRISQSRLERQGFEKANSLSSLRRCRGTREEEELKERIADEMLRTVPADEPRPVHTERRLARHVQGRCVIRLDAVTENIISQRPAQSALDELKFLMKLTPLTKRERFFLRGWMLGWTQTESSARWLEQYGSDGRYMVCRVIKEAVEKCREYSPLSFTAISKRTVYRRPARRSAAWRMIECRNCKEPFVRGFGEGIYCSIGCRDAFDHKAG